MTWHYVLNGSPAGPIDATELSQKVAEGVITPATLVWREGMTDWIPYSETRAAELPTAGGTTCTHCNGSFPPDQLIQLGGSPVCPACKPIALEKVREGVTTNSAAVQLRTQHLGHEASLRSVGVLYLVGGILTSLGGLLMLIGALRLMGNPNLAQSNQPVLIAATIGLVLLVVGGLQAACGFHLRRLRPLARIPVGIISALGLLAVPLGTLINGYILYLLFSKKGRFILSPEYQAIVAATPEIKYRTSIVIWILLGLVLVFIVGAIGASTIFGG